MEEFQTMVVLIAIAIILVGIALKLSLPYPVALVLGGAALGFTPIFAEVTFDPSLILVLVLPPALYYAAYNIRFKEFQANIREILWLASGLVLVTTVVIALLFKWLFPDLSWAEAFIFGAIISPPDAIAATAILRRFSISPRLVTVLEGESLINDAMGLLLYRIATIALLSGTFSFSAISIEFIKISGGGLLVGTITGFLFQFFSSRFFNSTLAVVFTLVIPYLTYILADSLQVSGVLAVVISGLIGSRMLVTHFSSLTRVVGAAFWKILIILLNCFVFILIGLQMQAIIKRLTIEQIFIYMSYGILLTAATIAVRFAWIYFRKATYQFRMHNDRKSILEKSEDVFILGWSGMRGIVSLALALGLPFNQSDGTPLPGRDIVIFIAFVVILLTLLIPGLSLPVLLKWLNIQHASSEPDTAKIREELIKTAQEEIQALHAKDDLNDEEHSFLSTYFAMRHRILEVSLLSKKNFHQLENARILVLKKKRQRLLDMWKTNEINDQLFNLLEHEIDLEEAYLERSEI